MVRYRNRTNGHGFKSGLIPGRRKPAVTRFGLGLLAASLVTTGLATALLSGVTSPSNAAQQQTQTVNPQRSGPVRSAGPADSTRQVIQTRIPAPTNFGPQASGAVPPTKPVQGAAGSQRSVISSRTCTDIVSSGFAPSDSTGAQGTAGALSASNVNMAWVNGAATTGSCPTVFSRSLKSFFGVTRVSETLFDPQVQYDDRSKKFIVLAESTDSVNTDQFLYIGVVDDVSRTSAPAGIFYKITLSAGTTRFCKRSVSDFYDYPKLGIGANALAVTSNNFPTSGSVYGTVIAARRDQAVAGAPLTSTCFGISSTVPVNTSPSHVLNPGAGGNTTTMLLPSPGSGAGSSLALLRLTWTGAAHTLATLPSRALPFSWTAPPNAKQPGTTARVDVLDGRFVSAGTQTGAAGAEVVHNVHSVACVTVSCARIYRITPGASATLETGSQWFFNSDTGFFNTSLAFNGQTKLFVTASSSGSLLRPGTSLLEFTKPGASFSFTSILTSRGAGICNDGGTRCRWGDYSQTTLAPTSASSLTRIGSTKVVSYDQHYTGTSQFNWNMVRTTGFFSL